MTEDFFRLRACGKGEKSFNCAHRQDGDLTCWGLVYLGDGRGFFDSLPGNGRQDVRSGDAFILVPGIGHSYGPVDGACWSEYWLLFEGSFPDGMRANGTIRPSAPLARCARRFGLDSLFNELLLLYSTGNPACAVRITMLSLSILSLTTAALTTDYDPADGEDECVNDVIEAMRQSIDQPFFDFQQAAVRADYSPAHMRRLFKARTGRPPVPFFNALKIAAAKSALLDTDKSIGRIIVELGFRDEAYFRRIFQRLEGMPPSEYRRRYYLGSKR